MAPERQRVLYLGPDVPGGMATSISALLGSPLADRYEIDVIATHRGSGAARRAVVFGAALLALVAWSLRGRGRLVHVHATVRGSTFRKAICVLLAKALRRRVLLHMHSGPGDVATFRAGLGSLALGLVRRAFARADRVLAVSTASAAAIAEAFDVAEIGVLPNPAPPSPEGSGRHVADPRPVFVYMGGFANPVKGGEVLLAALDEAPLEGARFVLAGPGEPPASGRRLAEAREGIEWRGWLTPAVREETLVGASVFVLPSTSEGLPMALLEAMAHGLAIVATAVGGVPDVVESGSEGLVVAPGDPAALAAAIERLAADPELRRRLGGAAKRKARELGPDRVAAQLDCVYRELLEARP